MNMAVRTLSHSAVSPIVLSMPLSIKNQLFLWILVLSVLVSAFGLIYIKDINRRMASNLQTFQETYQTLRIEESQLLLEKSTWSTHSRVEQVARQGLNMIIPSGNSVVLVHEE